MTATALQDLVAHIGQAAESLHAEGHEDLAANLLADALFVQVLAGRQAAGADGTDQLILQV
jgi:hypothetical protein